MSKPKLKVLQFISPTGFYGAERWVLALAKNLPNELMESPLLVTTEANIEKLEIEHYYKELDKVSYSIHLASKFDFFSVFRISKLIKKLNIDIIQTHNYKSNILGLLAARLAGIKCIITPHGYDDPSNKKLSFYNWIDKKTLKYADAVAPLSPDLLNDCKMAKVPNKKIHYIQNGVDLDELNDSLDQPLFEKGNNLIMGYIGQVISRKNVDHIIQVYANLKQTLPNLELHIIGDGDELERLKQLPYCDNNIKFLGFRKDRLQFLRNFDVFVLSSKLEGVPRCLMEASALGVPSVAYNIPGVDKIIRHGENGLLADYGSIAQLTANCKKLLTQPELRAKFSVEGQKIVQQEFSAKRMANEYIVLFDKLIDGQE
jgi:glycosyltransferase involved in cell wall biosynthesis